MLSAILLTSSVLLVLGMVSALTWLSAMRMRAERATVRVEPAKAPLDGAA